MTTNEIINLDYRETDNRLTLLKCLRKIPPLKDLDCFDTDMIQKAIYIMCKKYGYNIKIQMDPISGNKIPIWHAWIVQRSDLKTAGNIYAMCLEEMVIKVAIGLYSEVRRR